MKILKIFIKVGCLMSRYLMLFGVQVALIGKTGREVKIGGHENNKN